MSLSPKSTSAFVRDFRHILSGDDHIMWDALPAMVALSVQMYEQDALNDALSTSWSEIRVLLSRLAMKGPRSDLSLGCAQALLRFGMSGRRMAIDCFGSLRWPEQEVCLFLDRMVMQDKLLFIHHVLLHRDRTAPYLYAWTEEHLAAVSRFDPAEIYAFCVHVGLDEKRPPFVLRHYLLEGPFLPWLEGLCAHALPVTEKVRLVHAVLALDEPGLIIALAGHFSELRFEGQIRLCKAASGAFLRGDDRIVRVLCKGIQFMDEKALFACLRCLLALSWSKVDAMLHLLVRKRPDLAPRLRLFALFLSPSLFSAFCGSLPAGGRSAVHRSMLAGIARIDPDTLRFLCAEGAGLDFSPPFIAALTDHLVQWSQLSRPSFASRKKHVTSAAPSASLRDKIVSMFSKKQAVLGEALHSYASLEDCRFEKDVLKGRTISKSIIKGVGFPGCLFQRIVFDRVRFLNCDFTETFFDGCEFTACVFSGCTLQGSRMVHAKISTCHFESVDARDVVFDTCQLRKNNWRVSILSHVRFEQSSLQQERFSISSWSDPLWSSCVLTSCCFDGCDFFRGVFLETRWYGVETRHTGFRNTAFRALVMRNTRTEDSLLAECTFEGLDTTDPVFQSARQEEILWNPRLETVDPPALPADIDPLQVRSVLEHWRRIHAMRDTEQGMLANNMRRHSLAMEIFTPAQGDFFTLLPCLLHTTCFEEYASMQGIPRCRIQGFEPDYTQTQLLDTIFPYTRERGSTKSASDVLEIASVYTIGSIGTVAQNRRSDIDVWICLAGSSPSPELRSGLFVKCEAVTRWAEEKYGLEVHFFIMTLDEIRANNFGELSEEGSGSAQALLLKEEFYRTAVLLAGREPRWWVLPPLDEYPPEPGLDAYGRDRICDLGNVQKIPHKEFFGASLWQIVNFARNPYKSLLKLALLEKYALQGARSETLLSESIKRNVLRNMQEVYQIDPYGVLYKELLFLYNHLGDKDASDLLRESFQFKIRMQDIDFSLGYPRRQEEQSVLSFYFQSRAVAKDLVRTLGKPWSITKTMASGEAMNTFMLSAYRRIRDRVARTGNDVSIRPEEMTTLGRTISSFFSQEPGKVRRIFFLGPDGTNYQELYFFCQKGMDGTKVFAVKGRRPNDQRGLDHLEVIRRESSLVKLAAWLVMNGLYRDGVLVSGNSSLVPVSVAALQGVLGGMLEAFPPERAFVVDRKDMLEEKLVRNVLCIVNLEGKSDDSGPVSVDVDIVYSTTWGELFYMTDVSPRMLSRNEITGFLTRTIPCPLDMNADLFQFRPSSGRTIAL